MVSGFDGLMVMWFYGLMLRTIEQLNQKTNNHFSTPFFQYSLLHAFQFVPLFTFAQILTYGITLQPFGAIKNNRVFRRFIFYFTCWSGHAIKVFGRLSARYMGYRNDPRRAFYWLYHRSCSCEVCFQLEYQDHFHGIAGFTPALWHFRSRIQDIQEIQSNP